MKPKSWKFPQWIDFFRFAKLDESLNSTYLGVSDSFENNQQHKDNTSHGYDSSE
jgi:hypothetical protein